MMSIQYNDNSINYEEALRYIEEAGIDFDFRGCPTSIEEGTFSSADFSVEEKNSITYNKVNRVVLSTSNDKVSLVFNEFTTGNNGEVHLTEIVSEFEENLGKVFVTTGTLTRSNFVGENIDRVTTIQEMRNVERARPLIKITFRDRDEMPVMDKLLGKEITTGIVLSKKND